MVQGRAVNTVTGWSWKFLTKTNQKKNIAKQKNQANYSRTAEVYHSSVCDKETFHSGKQTLSSGILI